ncbi:unnamed protein product [Medioppia subpectinata]|uniref:CXXC motif containing zinc binding protein n=1 Tax=Medioppia subpectinata TaxID=1979941 RepID=A0A7R9KKE2_9ACAR|nr:unnamed protein product [Medioppia subpectinata]CAG2103943.1 unnamed protein product [Medioppia subpectinata]
MHKTALQMKAILENVTNLRPNGDDFRWYLKFKCNNCGEESDKWMYLSLEETFPMKGSKGEAHLVTKCKMCSRDCSVDVFPKPLDILSDMISKYTNEDSNTFKTIAAFDCRGLSIIDYSPRIGFVCEGTDSGTAFDDVNLEDNDWVDYDEKSNASVRVYDLQFKFITMKGK